IDLFNSLGLLNIGRVVDYTDLLALLILPLAWLLEEREANVYRLRIPLAAPLLLSLFAFTATSSAVTRRFSPDIQYTIERMPLDSFINALRPKIDITWGARSKQNFYSEISINFTDTTSADFMSISKFYYIDTLMLRGNIIILNPSDSIANIYAGVGKDVRENGIATIRLYGWLIKGHSAHESKTSFPYEQEKEHVKSVFEDLVVKPLNDSRGPNHSSSNKKQFPLPLVSW
ncbi:MAG: hypothetical protein KA149_05825, partial [Chitinophagales bacterium]|nr:hypothetical protein [Chitinophagales bacterium]